MNRVNINCTGLDSDQSIELFSHWLKILKIENIKKINFSEEFKKPSVYNLIGREWIKYGNMQYFIHIEVIISASVEDNTGALTYITAFRIKRATLEELSTVVNTIKNETNSK